MQRIEVEVKSIWRGLVAFHEKYIREAEDKKLPLVVIVKREQMTIPCDLIRPRLVRFSKERFQDKFSNDFYQLAYFRWLPDTQHGEARFIFEKNAKSRQNKLF
jgi:hypothetical protein